MTGLLNSIQHPSDVQRLKEDELVKLSSELREFLIETILQNGGHFAANLGVVELTVALHHVLDFTKDKLVFDVGHQSYAHKVLSGRRDQLSNIRSYQGLSGFPNRNESEFDHFGTGHSSTALSAIMGMAHSAHLQGKKAKYVAVVGDGAFTGGMMYEALNNLLQCPSPVWLILNDNQMGIDPNTGALNQHLCDQDGTIAQWCQWFHLEYSGPIDGHSIPELLQSFQDNGQPKHRLIHIKTTKGKGYAPAEKEQTRWHATSKFVKIDPQQTKRPKTKWQDLFGTVLLQEAERHPDLVGISPAMPTSCGMAPAFQQYPHRFWDTGIAEQHSVTFAAGLSAAGSRVVLNIYSTFLQRAMDQWVHDVALQNLGITLCIDRAGLVGEDGPTHHGMFDLNWLLPIPNLCLSTPGSAQELQQAMRSSLEHKWLCAIRYPRGEAQHDQFEDLPGKTQFDPILLHTGKKVAILSCGPLSYELQELLQAQKSPIALYHFPWIRHQKGLIPAPPELSEFEHVFTVEDGAIIGGWGHSLRSISAQAQQLWKHFGIGDQFVTHGSISQLRETCDLSPEQILKEAIKHLSE